ncbi:SDR family NAD(P)-dependent oxidoreductase, partial [Streptomyces sparsus]
MVGAGDGFSRSDAAGYRLRVDSAADHGLLLDRLAEDGRPLDAVVHLGAVGGDRTEPETAEQLLDAQRDSSESLLALARALDARRGADRPVSLYLVGAGSQAVLDDDRPGYAHAAALGLLKSLPPELPALRACHLDLPDDAPGSAPDPDGAAITWLLDELRTPLTDTEIALRQGQRWVRRLAPLPDTHARTGAAPESGPDGFLVVSGGLGGVAVRVAEHLLRTPGTRLLLLGRTPLPAEHTWQRHLDAGGEPARRVAAYRRLRELGDVRYESADVTDHTQVRAALEKATGHWSVPPTGVLHLAGTFDQRAVADLDQRGWRDALAAKVTGGWVLHRLAREYTMRSFVSFSSVNGYFGGSMSGAYSAANAFLDALAVHQRRAGLRAHSLAWSMWDELGMSEGYGLRALSEARGYRALDAVAALRSFDLVRALDEPHVLVGADSGAPWVGSHVLAPARPVQRLVGRVALVDDADLGAVHRG